MKRTGNLTDAFLSYENFDLAERRARRNKRRSKGVVAFDALYSTCEQRNLALNNLIGQIRSGGFRSTPPVAFKRMTTGGKMRNISVVPYWPDIVYAHAILNVVEKRFSANLIFDVYSYKRGVHLLCKRLSKVIRQWSGEELYVLKIDVRKFYESIDEEVLKQKVDKLIKDRVVKAAIFDIIDTHGGLTIGMLLSQLLSSVYLSDFDHWIKEELKVKHYYRYADDMVLLANTKSELHGLLYRMRNVLFYDYKLELKNWQIFEIKDRKLDYVGYVFSRTHTLIRKRIKKNFVQRRHNKKSVASYMGMLKWCNSSNLIHKILGENNHAKKRSN